MRVPFADILHSLRWAIDLATAHPEFGFANDYEELTKAENMVDILKEFIYNNESTNV